MINYLLEIVQINPLKQPLELEHWRFIHRSKAELADIDIDLNSSKADVVTSPTDLTPGILEYEFPINAL